MHDQVGIVIADRLPLLASLSGDHRCAENQVAAQTFRFVGKAENIRRVVFPSIPFVQKPRFTSADKAYGDGRCTP